MVSCAMGISFRLHTALSPGASFVVTWQKLGPLKICQCLVYLLRYLAPVPPEAVEHLY